MSTPQHRNTTEPGASEKITTLVDLLLTRADQREDSLAFSFSRDGEEINNVTITYRQLDMRARRIGADLCRQGASGQPVLVLCPPGIDFIASFFGCLYAGAIAVPTHPPMRAHLVGRVESIIDDVNPEFALTNSEIDSRIKPFIDQLPAGKSLRWTLTDQCDPCEDQWINPELRADSIAMLQYTSGSTSTPKGVILTHGNLVANLEAIRRAWGATTDMHDSGVFWLPPYHDMGLIGGLLSTLNAGGNSILMPPTAFIKGPMRWLRAISKHRAIITAAPNFAYDLCVELSTPEQRAELDLSSWRAALCGAEPVRASTLDSFTEAFAPSGFHRETFLPVFGLAEATLLVSGGPAPQLPTIRYVDRIQLQANRVRYSSPGDAYAASLVGCGHPQGGRVLIVDPDTASVCAEEEIGEIWVQSDSVAHGYWNAPEATQETFHATLANQPDQGFFLRTGDLGFLAEGELFVTGRVKDLIIIRGANHYPNDIELSVQDSHHALMQGRGAVFSIQHAPGEPEQVVILQEINPAGLQESDYPSIIETIRAHVVQHHGIAPYAVLLIQPLQLPTTSSGKIQRQLCKRQYLAGELPVIAQWTAPHAHREDHVAPLAEAPSIEEAPSTLAQEEDPHTTSEDLHLASEEESESRLIGVRTQEEITAWLVERLATELMLPPHDIDPDQPFAYYGLDSVRAVQLAHGLGQWLGGELSPTLAYEYPSIRLLSAYLAGVPSEDLALPLPQESSSQPTNNDPIAIIGIGCRFPGAKSLEEFWTLLSQGIDAITDIPADRWDSHQFYNPNPEVAGTAVSHWGGFLSHLDEFDYAFFGISPREAQQMDPQQRLLLETAWEALEDAGQIPYQLAGSQTGVFVGISTNDYSVLRMSQLDHIDAYTATGNALSIAANRLSYIFDFHGPSMSIDTACSSSLVAVNLACRSLRDGECQMALVGGVNVILSPAIAINFSKAHVISPHGQCRAFDDQADGYVRSEGAGVVVLKPLSQALADHDHIYAVIRGSAINSDGRTNGLIAPNPHAQEAVIRQAYQNANLSPGMVHYVETHGTGTALGDTIEASALGAALREGRVEGTRCLIGSVKTNIGHTEAAAGVAGLIKVALALKHRQIPASLHYQHPNSHIDFDHLPLEVVQHLQPWPQCSRAIAGISSFGFGGTNIHMVLTEAPHTRGSSLSTDTTPYSELLVLSAQDPQSLTQLAKRYQQFFADTSSCDLANVCYTSAVRRPHYEHRLAIVADSSTEMADTLQIYQQGHYETRPGFSVGSSVHTDQGVVFVFSGHGSQWHGMGQYLYDREPVFAQILDHLDHQMFSHLGCSISEKIRNGLSESDLDDVRLIQPMIFAIQVGLATLWQSWGIHPCAVVGHSFGEVAAAYIAQALTLEDAISIVCARSEILSMIRGQGGMLVADMTPQEATILLETQHSNAVIGSYNSYHSVVFSGDQHSLDTIKADLDTQDRFCRFVHVDVASHSPQIDPFLDQLRQRIAHIVPHHPQIPFFSTVLGTQLHDRMVDVDYWLDNIRCPVRFSEAICQLITQGYQCFLEISAHPVLAMAISDDATHLGYHVEVLASMRRDEERTTLLNSLGMLYALGYSLCWEKIYPSESRCVSCPPHPWKRVHSWYEPTGSSIPLPVPFSHHGRAEKSPEKTSLASQLYQLYWTPCELETSQSQEGSSLPRWIIFACSDTTTTLLCRHFDHHQQDYVLIYPDTSCDQPHQLPSGHYVINPWEPHHYRHLIEELFCHDNECSSAIVHLWNLDQGLDDHPDADQIYRSLGYGTLSAAYIIQSLLGVSPSPSPRLWFVTAGAQPVQPGAMINPFQAPIWGLTRGLDHEHPEFRCTRIDLPVCSTPADIHQLACELEANDRETDIGFANHQRWIARLKRWNDTDASLHDSLYADATYLVTGGTGALGQTLVGWLVDRGARQIVVMSRHQPSSDTQQYFDHLVEQGVTITSVCGDVSCIDDVNQILEQCTHIAPLRGIIHAAGIVQDSLIDHLTSAQLFEVLKPKVLGSWNLHHATVDRDLDFFILFSSASALLGSPGASNYNAANAFVDSLAWYRHSLGLSAMSIDWGPWAGKGMLAQSEFLRSYLPLCGIHAMDPDQYLQALTYLHHLLQKPPQVLVLDICWQKWPTSTYHSLVAGLLEPLQAELLPDFYSQLCQAAPKQRQVLLVEYLRNAIATKLGLSADKLDVSRALNTLGVDSLITLELRIKVERELGIVVPVSYLLEGPSIVSLAEWLANQISSTAPMSVSASLDSLSTTPSELLETIDTLSDSDVDALLRTMMTGDHAQEDG